jgi:CDP-paratose 2-epimerase
MQVRDLLFVEDLVDAIARARDGLEALSGVAFNIGGGAENAVSVLEVLEQIQHLTGRQLRIQFDEWRLGDQRYYVSDTNRFSTATGWRPRTGVQDGVAALCEWLGRSQQPTGSVRDAAPSAAAYP